MQSTAVHVGMQLLDDHEVEIWMRRKGEIRYACSDTIEHRMVPRGSNNKRLTDVGTISFVPTLVSLSLFLPPTVSLHS